MMGYIAGKIEADIFGLKTIEGRNSTEYIGSGAALVQSGLVRREQLPGPNGPRKRSAVYFDGVPASRGVHYMRDERYMRIALLGPDRFSVWFGNSQEERESKEARFRADLYAGIAAADARARAAAQLEILPTSREDYKEKLVADFEHFLQVAVSLLQVSHRHGYSLDERARQQVMAATAQLRATVRGGGVVFDRARHDQVVADLRAQSGLPPERPRLRLISTAGVA